ncbi:MAG: ABC transporter permease [Nocardioidaceae bacterium]
MSPRITWALSTRILRQLRRDHRTVALLLVLPCALTALLWWAFADITGVFARLGGPLLAVFPFIVMFLVTSVTTLSERTSGTLERLLAMPMGQLDFLLGYALAFGAAAVLQAALAVGLAVYVLSLHVAGSVLTLGLVAVADALLGTALGLLVSAFARTEFQAVQFMPAVVIPQLLLCGLFLPRAALPSTLHGISDVLPLSYAVDAMHVVTQHAGWSADLTTDLLVVAAWALGGLCLGAATLPRRTA